MESKPFVMEKVPEEDNLYENNIESIEDLVETTDSNKEESAKSVEESILNQILTSPSERPPSVLSEAMDPRKCDRLPPLGASSELPQEILPGEFTAAQRNEALSLLQRSCSR